MDTGQCSSRLIHSTDGPFRQSLILMLSMVITFTKMVLLIFTQQMFRKLLLYDNTKIGWTCICLQGAYSLVGGIIHKQIHYKEGVWQQFSEGQSFPAYELKQSWKLWKAVSSTHLAPSKLILLLSSKFQSSFCLSKSRLNKTQKYLNSPLSSNQLSSLLNISRISSLISIPPRCC